MEANQVKSKTWCLIYKLIWLHFKTTTNTKKIITPAMTFKQERRAQITDHSKCSSNFTEEKETFPIPPEKAELYYKKCRPSYFLLWTKREESIQSLIRLIFSSTDQHAIWKLVWSPAGFPTKYISSISMCLIFLFLNKIKVSIQKNLHLYVCR